MSPTSNSDLDAFVNAEEPVLLKSDIEISLVFAAAYARLNHDERFGSIQYFRCFERVGRGFRTINRSAALLIVDQGIVKLFCFQQSEGDLLMTQVQNHMIHFFWMPSLITLCKPTKQWSIRTASSFVRRRAAEAQVTKNLLLQLRIEILEYFSRLKGMGLIGSPKTSELSIGFCAAAMDATLASCLD
jgi:hypothetical protein